LNLITIAEKVTARAHDATGVQRMTVNKITIATMNVETSGDMHSSLAAWPGSRYVAR
jgi:hypothetical protein